MENGKHRRGNHRRRPKQGASKTAVILTVTALAVAVVVLRQSLGGANALADDYNALLSAVPSFETTSWDQSNPLAIPQGQAENLPSIRVEEPDINKKRKIYGGTGDKRHLGGFTDIDIEGISPAVWKHMIEKYGVHSLLDVGCGRGTSSLWFLLHGVKILCVEGSHDAVSKTMLPDPENQVVEHDFSRGPWWPADTYSACWAVEFLEHVSLQYQFNYIMAFRKCAVIFATSSVWGGWHHVEVHKNDWWIRKFNSYGLVYDGDLTKEVRDLAGAERRKKIPSPTGKNYGASHVQMNIKVFVNPIVAALPEHAGLFAEFGCYNEHKKTNRECGTGRHAAMETPLAPELYPLTLTPEMDTEWENEVKRHIKESSLFKPKEPEKEKSAKSMTAAYEKAVATALESSKVEGNWTHPLTLYFRGELELKDLPVLPTVTWPSVEMGIGNAETIHLQQSGLADSKRLFAVKDAFNLTDLNVIWIADTGFTKIPWGEFCDKLFAKLAEVVEKRRKLGLSLQWPVFVIDFTDLPSNQRCPQVEDLMGFESVRYSQRALVKGRMWVESKKWVRRGTAMNLKVGKGDTLKQYLHTPLMVRTDTIEHIGTVLAEKFNMTLVEPIEALERPVDVSHFWPSDGKNVGNMKAKLRHLVSVTIEEMGQDDDLNVFVGLAGSAVRIGRRGVQDAYINGLLNTKIVVVAQRDNWEDHYRLFEGLTSGALVMTDTMLSMPKELKNGTSLIEYNGVEELKSMIQYYLLHRDERLAIAREGRRIAMARHRSWHRLEEIVFGAPVSVCDENDVDSKCPYIVHANEARRRRR